MNRSLLVPVVLCVGCYTPPDFKLHDSEPFPMVPSGTCSPNRIESVSCVVDGDTFDLDACGADRTERVRLLGIDAPETEKASAAAECWANEAWAEMRRLVERRDVLLTFDRDCVGVYGRTLAYVWLDEPLSESGPGPDAILVNEWMLAEGYARIYPEDFGHPLRLGDRLEAAEGDAHSRGLGLWSACDDGGS